MVDLEDFREAVSTFSLGLGEAEVQEFFQGFDTDGSGGIDFEVCLSGRKRIAANNTLVNFLAHYAELS